jgi:hypothetical protein
MSFAVVVAERELDEAYNKKFRLFKVCNFLSFRWEKKLLS